MLEAIEPFIDLYAKPEQIFGEWIEEQNRQSKVTNKETNEQLILLEEMIQEYKRLSEFGKNFETEYGIKIVIKNMEPLGRVYEMNCTSSELIRVFKTIERRRGISCGVDKARSLTARLRNNVKILKESGWIFEQSTEHHGVRHPTRGFVHKLIKIID